MNALPVSTRRSLAWLSLAISVVMFLLHRGWGLDKVGGGFHPGHVWAVDQMAAILSGTESLSGWTSRIGYPGPTHLRFIGWAPLLLAAPLSWLLGAPVATMLVITLGLILSAWITAALIERITGAGWMVSSGAALVYALSPFALGVLANGQLAKLQLWCLPLVLWCTERLLKNGSRLSTIGWLFVCTVILGFTSPSVGLVTPVALGIWVLIRTPWSDGGVLRALLSLAIVAAGLAIPWAVHSMELPGIAAFAPASSSTGALYPSELSPVARPTNLLWGIGPWSGTYLSVNHVAALGVPAIGIGLVALFRPAAPARLGLALAIAGGALALGPAQVWGQTQWLLPAMLLDKVGYPLQESGNYYRFAQVASLGLAICTAAVAHRFGRWSVRLALLVGILTAADGIRATAAIWPRALQPIAPRTVYAQMAADTTPGAVLELPFNHMSTEGGRRVLGQLIHKRPTTALSRNIRLKGSPRLLRVNSILTAPRARQRLAQAGFRYVLLHNPRIGTNREMLQLLTALLGEPAGSNTLSVWVVPAPVGQP
jgi:hypothetical protein